MKRPNIPIEIILETTGRCRQICPYCTGPRIPDVPLDTIKKTIIEAASLGINTVRITGGEPLLHPEIKTILKFTKSKNLSVILNTSADSIAPDLMKTIISTVDVAHVSLQGHDSLSNKTYTGSKVSFLDKIKNIFLLKAYMPTLWLATVITPSTLKSFGSYTPLIKKINPSAWLLQRPISTLNEDLKQMGIPFYRKLIVQMMKAQQDHINVFISNPIPLCITGNLKIGQKVSLGAILDEGHSRIVRSAKGFFKPSYFIEKNLGDTIKEAWDHPFLHALDRTEYLPSLCQRCPVLERCRGGCRAMALNITGDPFAPDPLFDPKIAEKAIAAHQL